MLKGVGERLKACGDAAQFVLDMLHVKFLSYKIPACHTDRMNHEPNWKDRAEAANYWLATVVVAGAFVAGLISAVLYAVG